MKKLLALMLALIACITMLVSCGPDEESSSSESEQQSQSQSGSFEDDTSKDIVIEFDK